MHTIGQLLESCSINEKNLLLQYISIKNSPSSKKYRLLKLMIKNPELKDPEFASIIYDSSENSAYSQLKKRLTEELISHISLIKKSSFQKENCQRMQVIELLQRGQHFLHLDLQKEGVKYLKKALELAGKQGYTDLVLCIHETARTAGVAEPLNYDELFRLKNALCKQLELTLNNSKVEPEQNKANLISLKKSVLQTESNNEVLNLLEKSEMYLEQNSLKKASIAIQDAESILYSYPSIHQPEMVWRLNLTQQSVLLKYGAYEELINNCQKTIQIKGIPDHVKVEVYKNEWFAAFYLGYHELAKKILLKLARNRTQLNQNIWHYYESYLLFQEGKFQESLQLNHDCQRLLKSNTDYFLGSKLFEMMILIERNEWDWLEFKLENFRKTLYATKSKTKNRIQSFFHCLQHLQKLTESSRSIELKKFRHYQLLNSENESFSWQPGTFELIPYHQWIQKLSKVN